MALVIAEAVGALALGRRDHPGPPVVMDGAGGDAAPRHQFREREAPLRSRLGHVALSPAVSTETSPPGGDHSQRRQTCDGSRAPLPVCLVSRYSTMGVAGMVPKPTSRLHSVYLNMLTPGPGPGPDLGFWDEPADQKAAHDFRDGVGAIVRRLGEQDAA